MLKLLGFFFVFNLMIVIFLGLSFAHSCEIYMFELYLSASVIRKTSYIHGQSVDQVSARILTYKDQYLAMYNALNLNPILFTSFCLIRVARMRVICYYPCIYMKN